MIILEPMGGLANRMRVIASGIWLKNLLNTPLTVIWNENYELTCPYNALFEESAMFSIVAKHPKYRRIKSSNQPSAIKKWQAKVSNALLGVDYCIQETDFHHLIWTGKLDIYQAASKHKNIYIQTCQEFGDTAFAYQYFCPVPLILTAIEQITKKYAEYTIGVHIRQTDNEQAIQNSPVPLFIQAMETEIANQPDTVFFLSSDDLKVKNQLIGIFGTRIISSKNAVSRNTVTGMQDAVTDMYCLAKTNKILGSYYSSYNEVAARINHTELKVIKS